MKTTMIIAILASMAATPALAEPKTRTVTVDRPNVEGSRTVVRDTAEGTLSRDTEVTRKSDGATATRSYDRTRTEDGVVVSGSETGFRGNTRSVEVERERNENGFVSSGTATGRNGDDYALSGSRTRNDTGYTAYRNVTNGAGETLYNRDKSVSRENGQINRSVNVMRKQGVRPRPVRGARPGRRF